MTWDEIIILLDKEDKTTLISVILDLAATAPECNSCDDPNEVGKVVKDTLKVIKEN